MYSTPNKASTNLRIPQTPCSRSVCSECFVFKPPPFSPSKASLISPKAAEAKDEIEQSGPASRKYSLSCLSCCQGPHRSISEASAALNYEGYFQLCNLKRTPRDQKYMLFSKSWHNPVTLCPLNQRSVLKTSSIFTYQGVKKWIVLSARDSKAWWVGHAH